MDVSHHSYFTLATSKHGASEASTPSTTNLYSPIIRATYFTIHVGLSPVAQRNSEFYKNSFDACVKESDWVLDYMPYGRFRL